MQFTYSNRHDIEKYYSKTFIKLNEFGERLVFVSRVLGNLVECISEREEEIVIVLRDDRPYTCSFTLPHKATFQHGKEAFSLQRIPARKWKKGISNQNTVIFNDSQKACNLDFSILSSYVNKPSYVSLDEAVKSPNKSCALNRRMMYRKKDSAIILDTLVIGYYDKEANTPFAIYSEFSEEMKDLMNGNN